MLDWIRRHRVRATGFAAVVVLAAGALIVRASDDGDGVDAEFTPPSSLPPDTAEAPASLSASTSAAPAAESSAAEAESASPPESLPPYGYAGDVEVPFDPSGSRGEQTEFGARQVAIDYLVTVRQRLVYLTSDKAREVLTEWAAPGVTDDVIEQNVAGAAAIRDTLAGDGGQVWWVVAPLAIRVDAYSEQRAELSVWLMAAGASGADPAVSTQATQPMVRYQIDTVELVWAEGRWTVWSTTTVDGPTPMIEPSQQIANPDVFMSSLDGFGLIRRHRA